MPAYVLRFFDKKSLSDVLNEVHLGIEELKFSSFRLLILECQADLFICHRLVAAGGSSFEKTQAETVDVNSVRTAVAARNMYNEYCFAIS